MSLPDFEAAQQYVLRRIKQELPPELIYHSLCHTVSEVVPAVDQLAKMEGVSELDHQLVRTAAFFHDLGFIERYQGHEEAGARLAEVVLPVYGYSAEQVRLIQSMILATRLPQSPTTLLEEILVDADLDVLGKEDFLERNRDLRAELETQGSRVDDETWYSGQLRFLQKHQYFTAAARMLREPTKARNIQQLARLCQPGLMKNS